MSAYRACKNCKDRKVGCHGTCERYQSEKATRTEERIALHEWIKSTTAQRASDIAKYEYIMRNVWKGRKAKNDDI